MRRWSTTIAVDAWSACPPRVVCGTLAAVAQVLVSGGWHINTAFREGRNPAIRRQVAAVGRRVNTVCPHAAGLHQQLAVSHRYHHFCRPHAA